MWAMSTERSLQRPTAPHHKAHDDESLSEAVERCVAAISEVGVFGGVIDNRPELVGQARIIREMGQEFIRRARRLAHNREPVGHSLALETPACARRDSTEREMVDALLRLAETVKDDLTALMETRDETVRVRSMYDLGRALLDHGTYIALWVDMPQSKVGRLMGVTGPRVAQWRTEEKASTQRR